MLNFECANCGRIEMLHLGRDVIEKFVRMALWTADWEYREDPPPIPSELQTVEEVMGFLFEHEKGYRYSLEKCPGFSYRKHERAEIIDMFCRTASNMLDFLPEEWQRFSERVRAPSVPEIGRYYLRHCSR